MKKSISYLVAISTVSILLAGCNKPKESTESTNSTNPATTPSTDNSNVVDVSVTGATPPFSFRNEQGEAQGIDIDIINEIGKLEGFKPEFKITTWDGMFSNLDNGHSKIAVSGISFRPDRAEKYGLSQSYFFNPSAMVTRQGANQYKTLNDAMGKRITASEGKGKSREYAESVKDGVLSFQKSPYLIFDAVVKDKADVGIYDQTVLNYFAKSATNQKLNIIPIEAQSDPRTQTVVVTHKADAALLGKINEGLTKLKQQGKLAEIEKKWMGNTTGTTTVIASAPTNP